MRAVPVQDVLALKVPPQWRADAEQFAAGGQLSKRLADELNALATSSITAQYKGRRGLKALAMGAHEWLITGDPDELDRFQPGDGCPACIAGSDQAKAALREDPDALIALGNLHYVEMWTD